jgi:hypothetical protein
MLYVIAGLLVWIVLAFLAGIATGKTAERMRHRCPKPRVLMSVEGQASHG